jgi:hypothetical protein
MNVNKYFFRTLALLGFLLIVSSLFLNYWRLDIIMGDLKPNVDARIFESFDVAAFSGNFSKFDDFFAGIVRYCYIAILAITALNIILLFGSASLQLDKRKPFHVLIMLLSIIILMLAIAIFVLSIIFVKTNTITQENGFTLEPKLLNGVYITIMGGFCAGLFGSYAVIYDSK